MKPLTAMQRRTVMPLKQTTPSRSPTATPPISQQETANTTQASLVGMTKEEKAAEMNRRKEERKQVSGARAAKSAIPTDKTITAHRSAQGPKSFWWETMKQISRSMCGGSFSQVSSSPLSLEAVSVIAVLHVLVDGITPGSLSLFRILGGWLRQCECPRQ